MADLTEVRRSLPHVHRTPAAMPSTSKPSTPLPSTPLPSALRRAPIALALVLAALLAGCAGGGAEPAASATTSPEGTADGVAAGTAEGTTSTRTVEDAVGTVEVPAEPARPVPLDGVFAANMLTLGVEPVAVPQDVKLQLSSVVDALPDGAFEGYRAFVADELEALPEIGMQYDINLEALAVADPDLIVAADVEDESMGEEYRAIAPTYLTEWPHNGAWRPRFLRVAEALGREEEARAVEDAFDAYAASLPDAVREQTVAFVRASALDDIRADVLETSFAGSVAREAGIPVLDLTERVDVPEDASWIDLSEETLDLPEDADVIVLSDLRAYDPTLEPSDEVLAGSPLWDALPAVQDGRVAVVPGTVYNGGHHAAATALLAAISEASGAAS